MKINRKNISQEQITAAVEAVCNPLFDPVANPRDGMYKHLIVHISQQVAEVLAGTIKLGAINHEFATTYIIPTLEKLHVKVPNMPHGPTLVERIIATVTGKKNDEQTDQELPPLGETARREYEEKKNAKPAPKKGFSSMQKALLTTGILAAAGGGAVALDAYAHMDHSKKVELEVPPEIPNAYKLDASQPIAPQFLAAIPGLANQLQTQLDACVRDLPADDETRHGVKMLSPTGFLYYIHNSYQNRPDILGRILEKPLPRCTTTKLTHIDGFSKGEENTIVLNQNNPRAFETTVHELTHAMLQHDEAKHGTVIHEGTVEYKTRQAIESADFGPYEKITFRSFLMDFLDPDFLEHLFQNELAKSDFDFNSDFLEGRNDADENLIRTLPTKVILERFSMLEPSPVNARMTVYFLAHAMKDGLLTVEQKDEIYERHVKPFEQLLDTQLRVDFIKVDVAFSRGETIENMPSSLQSVTEPLSEDEVKMQKESYGEAANFKIQAPEKFPIDPKRLIQLIISLSYAFVAVRSVLRLKENTQLLDKIRHTGVSPKFRQAILLYGNPALKDYLPVDGGSHAAQAGRGISALTNILMRRDETSQKNHFLLTTIVSFLMFVACETDLMTAGGTVSASVYLTYYLVLFSDIAVEQLVHRFEKIIPLLSDKQRGEIRQDRMYLKHPHRNLIIKKEDQEKSRELDKIPLPLMPGEKPVQCGDLGHGLFLVTVEAPHPTGKKSPVFHHVLVPGPTYDNCLPEKYFDREKYTVSQVDCDNRQLAIVFNAVNQGAHDTLVIQHALDESPREGKPYDGKVAYAKSLSEVTLDPQKWVPTFVRPASITEVFPDIRRRGNILIQKARCGTGPTSTEVRLYTLLHFDGSQDQRQFLNDAVYKDMSRTTREWSVYAAPNAPQRSGFSIAGGAVCAQVVSTDGLPFPQGMFRIEPVGQPLPLKRVAQRYADEIAAELDKMGVTRAKDYQSKESITLSSTEASGVLGHVRKVWPTDVLYERGFLKAKTRQDSNSTATTIRRMPAASTGGNERKEYTSGDDAATIDWKKTAGGDRVFVKEGLELPVQKRPKIIVNINSLLDEKYYTELFQTLFNCALYRSGRGDPRDAFDMLEIHALHGSNNAVLHKYSLKNLKIGGVKNFFDEVIDEVQKWYLTGGARELQGFMVPKPIFFSAQDQKEALNVKRMNLIDTLISYDQLPHPDRLHLTRREVANAQLIGFEKPEPKRGPIRSKNPDVAP